MSNPAHTVPFDIKFPYTGVLAKALIPGPFDSPHDIVEKLSLPKPKAIMCVIGGAGLLTDDRREQLVEIYERGIARAAKHTGAAIITGGTDSGVMEMMGKGVEVLKIEGADTAPVLIGVSPLGKVVYPGGAPKEGRTDTCDLEPHHGHFCLVDTQEWGGETSTMFQLAQNLAFHTCGSSNPMEQQAVTVLSNGGGLSKNEAYHCVKSGWPLVVLKGSGRLADEIASLIESHAPFTEIADPMLREIVEKGDIHVFELGLGIAELEKLLTSLYRMEGSACCIS